MCCFCAGVDCFIKRDQLSLLPEPVDVFLREYRPEPSFERPAPRVGFEFGAPPSIFLQSCAEEVRIQRIGQLAARAVVARNAHGRRIQLLTIEKQKLFPRCFVPACAGARQDQVIQMQALQKPRLIAYATAVAQRAPCNAGNQIAKLGQSKAVCAGPAGFVEVGNCPQEIDSLSFF
jgi:hypothetical protein